MNPRLIHLLLLGSLVFSAGCYNIDRNEKYLPDDNNANSLGTGTIDESAIPDNSSEMVEDCSPGWTITSYWVNIEDYFSGEKAPAFNQDGMVIGYYKTDFLEHVMIDAMGKGDGDRNNRGVINFNYDEKGTYRLTDVPEDYFGKPMVAWISVAANPELPENTSVLIKNLREIDGPVALREKIEDTKFHAVDTMGASGKRIDIFVGYQDTPLNPDGSSPSELSFKFEDATVCLSYPNKS